MADRELEKLARYMVHIATIPDFTALSHKVCFRVSTLLAILQPVFLLELEACYQAHAFHSALGVIAAVLVASWLFNTRLARHLCYP